MDKQGQIFVDNLKTTNGQNLDLFPLISLYALDVICGKKINNCQVTVDDEKLFAFIKSRQWVVKSTHSWTRTPNTLKL